MEPVLQQLAASAIIAIFTGLGGQFLKRMKARNDHANRAWPLPSPPQQAPYAAAAVPGWQPPAVAPAWQPPAPSVSSGQVLIHIGLLQFAVNVVGFIIGFTVAALGATSGASKASINSTTIALVLLFGSLTAIAAVWLPDGHRLLLLHWDAVGAGHPLAPPQLCGAVNCLAHGGRQLALSADGDQHRGDHLRVDSDLRGDGHRRRTGVSRGP